MNKSNPDRRPTWRRYGVACCCVMAAFGIRFSLTPVIGDKIPFLLFVPASLLVAWYGGLRPAVFVLIAGLLLSNFFFVGQWGKIFPSDLSELLQNIVYVFSTLLGI